MEQKIARILSLIIHPGFIPFYITALILYTDPLVSFLLPAKGKLMISGILFLTTVILPYASAWLFYRLKMVKSVFPGDREERIYLLLNAAVFYFLSYYLVRGHQVLLVLSYFLLGSTLLVISALIINFFYRISLHMIAAGGILGAALWISFARPGETIPLLFAAILFAGITGTLRLMVKPEYPGELWYGLLAGSAVMFTLFSFA